MRASNIWKSLKEEKHKYGSGHEIAVLGVLASMDLSEEVLVREIIEADQWLGSLYDALYMHCDCIYNCSTFIRENIDT